MAGPYRRFERSDIGPIALAAVVDLGGFALAVLLFRDSWVLPLVVAALWVLSFRIVRR